MGDFSRHKFPCGQQITHMIISTIITVYNLEKYIEEAIESVFSQTRLPDEVIVIDDCSTDNSAKILQKYADKITYIKMPENSGVLMAFIRGIEVAKGDILTFLDGDDIWYPTKVEEVEKAFLENEDRILVTHDYECIDDEGLKRSYMTDPTHFNMTGIAKRARDLDEMDKLLRNSMLSYKGVWLGSAFSLRRKYLDLNSFKKLMTELPDANLSHQDQPIAAYTVLENKDKKVFFINKILFKYRVFGLNSSGVSNDLKSAFKTLARSRATIIRTSYLVSRHPELVEEKQRQEMFLLNLDYLAYLYQKKYAKAFQHFLKLFFNFWTLNQKIKESMRFFGVLLLGPEKFFTVKSKKVF